MDKFLNLFSIKKASLPKKRYENCIITNPINIEYHPESEIPSISISKGQLDTIVSQDNRQQNLQQTTNDVIVVNNFEKSKKVESVYGLKYSQKINSLKLSNPIMIERENMKMNFDIEVIDYLLSDMMMIFKDKIKTLDANQIAFMSGLNESRELVNLLHEMYNESTVSYNIESNRKLIKIFEDIDSLELIVNSLGNEVDSLMVQSEKIDQALN